MGLLGKVMRKKRLSRRLPESSRKRKLGGNSKDHRPYFTYWVTFVQTAILFISLLLYGLGPIGVDLYKRSNMVSRTMEKHPPVNCRFCKKATILNKTLL